MIIETHAITWRGAQGTVCMSDLLLPVWPTVLTLRSHKTGKEVGFYCSGLKRDREGDIEFGTYRSVNFTQKLGLTILND